MTILLRITLLTICLAAAITAAVGAEPLLQPVGVIGNPGEFGPSLIRQGGGSDGEHPVGCGVVLDPRGTLWTRMAADRVSRLARDGRMLAQFPAPPSTDRYDTLTLVGGLLVLRAGDALATLSLEAAPGTAFQPLGVKLRLLARTPCKGRLAAVTMEGKLVWVDPVDGKLETVADTPDAWLVESTPDGVILVGTRADGADSGLLRSFVAGREVTAGGWPRPLSGQHVMVPRVRAPAPFLQGDGEGGFFQGGGGFLAHLNAQFEPAPGTLLGAQNGNVIGGGDWRPELEVARGIVRCGDGVYAVGGADGGIFFATWPDTLGPMRLAARLTSVRQCDTLAVNANGTVIADQQAFAWTSRPDDFPAAVDKAGLSLKSPIVHVGSKLLARIDNWGHMTAFAIFLYRGERLEESKPFMWVDDRKQAAGTTALWVNRAEGGSLQPAVAVADGQGWLLLSLATPTDALVLRLHADGKADQALGPVSFTWSKPVKALTGLARRNDTTLLAVVDGQIATLVKEGEGWKETARWNSWGGDAAEKFGATIHIACDGQRLLVADTDRYRILLFAADGGVPLAQVGTTDRRGDGLAELDRPTLVDIQGARAVVYDAGNQRIVKLRVGR